MPNRQVSPGPSHNHGHILSQDRALTLAQEPSASGIEEHSITTISSLDTDPIDTLPTDMSSSSAGEANHLQRAAHHLFAME